MTALVAGAERLADAEAAVNAEITFSRATRDGGKPWPRPQGQPVLRVISGGKP